MINTAEKGIADEIKDRSGLVILEGAELLRGNYLKRNSSKQICKLRFDKLRFDILQWDVYMILKELLSIVSEIEF